MSHLSTPLTSMELCSLLHKQGGSLCSSSCPRLGAQAKNRPCVVPPGATMTPHRTLYPLCPLLGAPRLLPRGSGPTRVSGTQSVMLPMSLSPCPRATLTASVSHTCHKARLCDHPHTCSFRRSCSPTPIIPDECGKLSHIQSGAKLCLGHSPYHPGSQMPGPWIGQCPGNPGMPAKRIPAPLPQPRIQKQEAHPP